MKGAAIALLASTVVAEAETWQPLDGAAITQALAGRTLDYPSAWQWFHASGRTLYHAGADSSGKWEVRGDAYCSQWPPNTAWTCYDVEISVDGARIRFSRGDDITVGSYRD